MASINLIDSFQEFKEAENIDRPTLMKVMEDVFKTLIRKKYGSDECFDVIIKNIGLSTAHRIRIDSDDLTRENTGIASFEFHKLTPYPLLNTNDSFRIKFFTSGRRISTAHAIIIWDDDFKKGNKKEQILQF